MSSTIPSFEDWPGQAQYEPAIRTILLKDGDLLPIAQAAKNHPKFSAFDADAIHRWAKVGHSSGIRLESLRIGNELCTSQKAFDRFWSAMCETKHGRAINRKKKHAKKLPTRSTTATRSVGPSLLRKPMNRAAKSKVVRNTSIIKAVAENPRIKPNLSKGLNVIAFPVTDARAALEAKLQSAEKLGWSFIEINAGILYRAASTCSVQTETMAICCDVMNAAMVTNDRVTVNAAGCMWSNLTIRYTLPRPKMESEQVTDFAIYWKDYINESGKHRRPITIWTSRREWFLKLLNKGDRLWLFVGGDACVKKEQSHKAHVAQLLTVESVGEDEIYGATDGCILVSPPLLADGILRRPGSDSRQHIGIQRQTPFELNGGLVSQLLSVLQAQRPEAFAVATSSSLHVLKGAETNQSATVAVNVRTTTDPLTSVKDDYEPDGIDNRSRTLREIAERPGQGRFKDSLIRRYGCRCQITGCSVREVIEAAHINPYRGPNDDNEQNGLLLRADVHSLFDCDLLAIEPQKLTVVLHPRIADSYGYILDKHLRCTPNCRPAVTALRDRYERFRERLSSSNANR